MRAKLEEQNPDFFLSYDIQLRLKDQIARPRVRRSTVIDSVTGESKVDPIRTSEQAFLNRGTWDIVTKVEERLAVVTQPAAHLVAKEHRTRPRGAREELVCLGCPGAGGARDELLHWAHGLRRAGRAEEGKAAAEQRGLQHRQLLARASREAGDS